MMKSFVKEALAAVCLILSVLSCSQKGSEEEEYPVGPYFGKEGFVFLYDQSTDALTEAHEAVIELPSVAGEMELSFVSFGLYGPTKVSGPDDIAVEALYKGGSTEGDPVYGEKDGMVQYIQKMKVTYGNKQGVADRTAVYHVVGDDGYDGVIVECTLKQR